MRIGKSVNNLENLLQKIRSTNLKDEEKLKEMLLLYFLAFGNYSNHYYRQVSTFETKIGEMVKSKTFLSSFDRDFIVEHMECLPEYLISQISEK